MQLLKDDENLSPILSQEGDEEEPKEGIEIKIVTLNKGTTRLPVLLAQIKAGNNSWKLNIEIRQILYFFTCLLYNLLQNYQNTLQQFNSFCRTNNKKQEYLINGEVLKLLDFQSWSPAPKTNGWLQGQLSHLSF